MAHSPPVEINTLAWLCRGAIGRVEVNFLGGSFETWQSIIDPEFGSNGTRLDESERLDRFLLLVVFGAHVEERLRGGHVGSIFSAYIQSCRPAIAPVIISEVLRRLADVQKKPCISSSTFRYFVEGRSSGGAMVLTPGQAEKDLSREEDEAARNALRSSVANMTEALFATPFLDAMERSPLLPAGRTRPENAVPHGWKVVAANNGPPCYEDEFTQSVSLRKPRVNPIMMRQVKVGLLHDVNGLWFHVDLLSCMRAGSAENSQLKLDRELDDRFPRYDDAWFAEEWNREPNTDDILGTIRAPWRIALWRIEPFAESLREPALDTMGFMGRLGVICLIEYFIVALMLRDEPAVQAVAILVLREVILISVAIEKARGRRR